MSSRIRFYESPDYPHIRFVKGEDVTHAFSRHIHETFIIGRVDSGSRIIRQTSLQTFIPEGCFFVLNPSEPHSCKPGDGKCHSYSVFAVSESHMASIVSIVAGRPVHRFRFCRTALPVDYELANIFAGLEQSLTMHSSGQMIHDRFASMISHLIRLAGISKIPFSSSHVRNGISRAMSVIENRYSEPLTLDELSKTACLSPFHFQRSFLSEKGITPHEYQVRQRVKMGVSLMKQGWSLSQTASETGFSDQSHFTRVFKKYIGITPGVFTSLNVKKV